MSDKSLNEMTIAELWKVMQTETGERREDASYWFHFRKGTGLYDWWRKRDCPVYGRPYNVAKRAFLKENGVQL